MPCRVRLGQDDRAWQQKTHRTFWNTHEESLKQSPSNLFLISSP